MLTARTFLVRGLLAGLLAGFVAFGVAYVVGEPSVGAAIAIEESGETGHTHQAPGEPGTTTGSPADEPSGHSHGGGAEVPRSLQSTLGLLTGTVVAGTTVGGLVGVVSALALGRLGRLSPRASTLAVAGLGLVSIYLVPFAGYPPNPPAVGHADTIGLRTALWAILLGVSLIAVIVAVMVGRRLAARIGGWHAFLIGALGYLAVCAVTIGLMPAYDEVPDGFPASLLYNFRMSSLATQLALWGTLGIVLAEFVGRLTAEPSSEPMPAGVA